jgi:hypothetical protein
VSEFWPVSQLWQWLLSLPPDFAFLLTLPFLVAFAGILGELARRRRHRLPHDDSAAAGGQSAAAQRDRAPARLQR